MTMDDIDTRYHEVARRVGDAVHTEFLAVRADVRPAGVRQRAPMPRRRRSARWWLPAIAVGGAAAAALGIAFIGRGDDQDAQQVDTVEEVPPAVEPAYFLPSALPEGATLERVEAPAPSDPKTGARHVRSYRERGTDRFVVVETASIALGEAAGGPGIEPVDIGAVHAVLTSTAANATWLLVEPDCADAYIVGRYLDRDATVAAARSVHCAADGTVAIDPPAGFDLVYDGPPPGRRAGVAGSLHYQIMSRSAPYGDNVQILFMSGEVDAESLFLTSVSASRLESVARNGRDYAVIASEMARTVNGVTDVAIQYTVGFVEDGTLVAVYRGGSTAREEMLALADSVRRVEPAAFEAALDQQADDWRKPAYFVPDVVPGDLVVRATESRQLIGFNIARPDFSINYSVSWGRYANGPAREISRTAMAGDRRVDIVEYEMAAPPPNGEPSTGAMVPLRDFTWQATPDVRVVISTMSGPEADADLLAIIGGLRAVTEAEWKTYLAAHDGSG